MSENILEQIAKIANETNSKVVTLRKGETVVEVDKDNLRPLITRLVQDLKLRLLTTITGLDLGQEIGIMYHFSHERETIHVRTKVAKTAAAPSIVKIIPGAILYEMEVHDMFGTGFEGNPWNDKKLLLPDNWPSDLPPPLLKSSKPAEIRKRLHLEVEPKK